MRSISEPPFLPVLYEVFVGCIVSEDCCSAAVGLRDVGSGGITWKPPRK